MGFLVRALTPPDELRVDGPEDTLGVDETDKCLEICLGGLSDVVFL